MLTDRFEAPASAKGYPCELSGYCGGDFQGIVDRLAYIKVRRPGHACMHACMHQVLTRPASPLAVCGIHSSSTSSASHAQGLNLNAVWSSPVSEQSFGGYHGCGGGGGSGAGGGQPLQLQRLNQ